MINILDSLLTKGTQIRTGNICFPRGVEKDNPIYIEHCISKNLDSPASLTINAYEINIPAFEGRHIDGTAIRQYVENNGCDDIIFNEETPIATLNASFTDNKNLIIDKIRVDDKHVRKYIGSFLIKTAEDIAFFTDHKKFFANNHDYSSKLKYSSNAGFIGNVIDKIKNNGHSNGAKAYNEFLQKNGFQTEQDNPYFLPRKTATRTQILQPNLLASACGNGTTPLQVAYKTFDGIELLRNRNMD